MACLFTGDARWPRSLSSVAFSPDGQHIVSSSKDLTIGVWNAMTGETVACLFTGHAHSVNSVAFSRDGEHIVSGGDRTSRVWNAVTGEKVAGPFTGHTCPVESVAFSPDGRHIVSGSFDQTIRMWNAMTRDSGRPFHRTHRLGRVCGIFARWPTCCLRFK